MSGAIRLATGLFTAASGGWILYAIVAGAGAAAGVGATWWIADQRIHALHSDVTTANTKADAAETLLATANAQNLNLSKNVNDQQATMNDMADKAARIAKSQTAQIAVLTEQRRSAQNQTDQTLDTLKGRIDVRSIVISPEDTPGLDPVVLAGVNNLRCLQSARLKGLPAAGCSLQAAIPAGGPGTAGSAAGAGHPVATVTQQLYLLGLVYRFRDWGVACYDDKAAISASEAAGPKP